MADIFYLVPRDRYPALNRQILSLFDQAARHPNRRAMRGYKRLMEMTVELCGRNINGAHLGDIIQLRSEKAFQLLKGDMTAMFTLLYILDQFGLKLDMKVPGWTLSSGHIAQCMEAKAALYR